MDAKHNKSMKLKIVFFVVAVILLVIGFVVLKPKQAPKNASQSAPATKTFNLVIKNHKVTSGPTVLMVNQGDDVVINITNDEDEELHLHGYDKATELQKDKPAALRFTANLTGNFPYELEHSGTELGSLQVLPK